MSILDATAAAVAKTLLPETPSQLVGRRRGTVITHNRDALPPTVDVALGTTTLPGVRYLNSYMPSSGDVVFVDFTGPDPLVIGKTAADRAFYVNDRLRFRDMVDASTHDMFVYDNTIEWTANFWVRGASNWIKSDGRVDAGLAKMGTHPVHTDYAWFGRTGYEGSLAYSFLTNGVESIMNATSNVYQSRNGSWVTRLDASGFYVRDDIGVDRNMRMFFSGWDGNLSIYCPSAGAGSWGAPWGQDGLAYHGWNTHTFVQAQYGVYGMQLIEAGEMWVRRGVISDGNAFSGVWAGSGGHAVFRHKDVDWGKGYMQRSDQWMWLMTDGRCTWRLGGHDSFWVAPSGHYCDMRATLPVLGGATMIYAGSGQFGSNGSSASLKREIQDLPESGANNPLWKLRPRRFKWQEDKVANGRELNEKHPKGLAGLIAEEVEAVIPEAINDVGPFSGVQVWDERVMIAYLVDAVQYLRNQLPPRKGT